MVLQKPTVGLSIPAFMTGRTLKAQLAVRGGANYSQELAAQLGFLYKQNGAVVVARSREELAELEKLAVNGRANGVKGLSLLKPGRN